MNFFAHMTEIPFPFSRSNFRPLPVVPMRSWSPEVRYWSLPFQIVGIWERTETTATKNTVLLWIKARRLFIKFLKFTWRQIKAGYNSSLGDGIHGHYTKPGVYLTVKRFLPGLYSRPTHVFEAGVYSSKKSEHDSGRKRRWQDSIHKTSSRISSPRWIHPTCTEHAIATPFGGSVCLPPCLEEISIMEYSTTSGYNPFHWSSQKRRFF